MYVVVRDSLLSSSYKLQYKSDEDILVLYKFICFAIMVLIGTTLLSSSLIAADY